jgi:hypothetical protein
MELKNILVEGDARATALKLLEWLKGDCLHGLVGVKRGQCSECMSELEAMLRE